MQRKQPMMSGFLSAVIQSNNLDDFQKLYVKHQHEPAYWNGVNRFGETVFMLACRYHRIEMIDQLLALQSVDVDAVNEQTKETAFSLAARSGFTDILDRLLNRLDVKLTGSLYTGGLTIFQPLTETDEDRPVSHGLSIQGPSAGQ